MGLYPLLPVSVNFSEFYEPTLQDFERFQLFLKEDLDSGCIIWCGSLDDCGYGWFGVGSRKDKSTRIVRAHRLAWVFSGREITKEKPLILHNCPSGDNPSCCNPLHLWDGTNEENHRDKAKKGRGRKGYLGLPTGVTIRPNGTYRARIWQDLKYRSLGEFETLEEAESAVRTARSVLYGVSI